MRFKDIQSEASLKVAEPTIPDRDIWKDDVLDRQDMAKTLSAVVKNQKKPLVLCLHGAWGTGKTFLLKRWKCELEKSNVRAIYFNAWEDDFLDDPFVALIGQLASALGEKEVFREPVKNVVAAAAEMFKQQSKKRLGLDLDAVAEVTKDKALENYTRHNQNRKRLKDDLKNLTDEVQSRAKHPLVFIIDELDRCRPTFSVELLERVKHIFDVPNIVFVLGVDHDQLQKSIKAVYGAIAADIYLRRFFDLTLTLPKVKVKKFCQHLIRQYGLLKLFEKLSEAADSQTHQMDSRQFSNFFPSFVSRFDMSLRDIDYCVRSVVQAVRNLPQAHRLYPVTVGALVVLRLLNPQLYRELRAQKSKYKKVLKYFSQKTQFAAQEPPEKDKLLLVECFFHLVIGTEAGKQLEAYKNRQGANLSAVSTRVKKSAALREQLLRHIRGNFDIRDPFFDSLDDIIKLIDFTDPER